MVTAYQLSPCTAVGDQRGLWAIPGSAQGESSQCSASLAVGPLTSLSYPS